MEMKRATLSHIIKQLFYSLVAIATVFATLAITTDVLGSSSWRIVATNFIIIWLCLFLIIFYRTTFPSLPSRALNASGSASTSVASLLMISALWLDIDHEWYLRSILFLTLLSGFLVYVALVTSMQHGNKDRWLYNSSIFLCTTLFLQLSAFIIEIHWSSPLPLVNAIFLTASTVCLIIVSFTRKRGGNDHPQVESIAIRQITIDTYIDDRGRIYKRM